jgi:UDP-N-acetyl-D-mannosaminuronic acid dehydrogenase
MICDKLGVNVWELIELANKHPRVNILKPGPGVGGHCIAVDPWFIVSAAPEQAKLIRTAREVNESKPHWVVERVRKRAGRFVDPVIGCLGLSYKADVDDIRESPALEITRQIQAQNLGRVMVCEPYVSSAKAGFPLHDLETIVREADILVLLVDHSDFKDVDRDVLKEKVVIDTRGIWR